MQEDYDITTDYSALLQTCLERLWPSEDHNFRQSFHICQHLLEDSLATARHKTLFVDSFPYLDRWPYGICESLGSTTALLVQPQALLDMG